ncbi:hypothetical protein D9M69_480290 [compost metagenome]
MRHDDSRAVEGLLQSLHQPPDTGIVHVGRHVRREITTRSIRGNRSDSSIVVHATESVHGSCHGVLVKVEVCPERSPEEAHSADDDLIVFQEVNARE